MPHSHTFVSYSEKLKDPRWQKKRLRIFERDVFTCQECGETSKPLNVHHLQYDKGASPWEYEDGLLITLCERCHETRTKFVDKVKPWLAAMPMVYQFAILGFIQGLAVGRGVETDPDFPHPIFMFCKDCGIEVTEGIKTFELSTGLPLQVKSEEVPKI